MQRIKTTAGLNSDGQPQLHSANVVACLPQPKSTVVLHGVLASTNLSKYSQLRV